MSSPPPPIILSLPFCPQRTLSELSPIILSLPVVNGFSQGNPCAKANPIGIVKRTSKIEIIFIIIYHLQSNGDGPGILGPPSVETLNIPVIPASICLKT